MPYADSVAQDQPAMSAWGMWQNVVCGSKWVIPYSATVRLRRIPKSDSVALDQSALPSNMIWEQRCQLSIRSSFTEQWTEKTSDQTAHLELICFFPMPRHIIHDLLIWCGNDMTRVNVAEYEWCNRLRWKVQQQRHASGMIFSPWRILAHILHHAN